MALVHFVRSVLVGEIDLQDSFLVVVIRGHHNKDKGKKLSFPVRRWDIDLIEGDPSGEIDIFCECGRLNIDNNTGTFYDTSGGQKALAYKVMAIMFKDVLFEAE